MKHLLTLALSLFILTSCTNDDERTPVDYREQNETDIQAYITDNELNATRTDSGLYYVIDEQGEGEQPVANSNVTVAYKGYFLNGNVFDQSDAEGVTFNLQQVIPGWTEGITYFNEGGSGMLLVPAHLGYGSFYYNGIPGGSVLIFDIELLAVN
ncbi:FKBP-type peptidyl-prolyl cis-trans isomerase [Tamlana crocina]|uniref:Peptidyl-prolyl cis-trans isomerase n=1 Tax=Tamlana crocina TaxID=393006 RepID=A0ABX1DEC0_9FLAO|nr:FKBP-type peptidyl-prolyl cis-trans isomerase [Tamlana crocina]NJX14641.1 peptidylprolyl isomerase [Tamlana crocina]